jgi:branched-chain amino acid transport system substrate-binding protein
MRTKIGFVGLWLLALLITGACDEKAPDKIVFGQAVSLSGARADLNMMTTEPIYQMWIDEINDDGGLYIEKYDKKIPVELMQYDDESDIEKMKSQLTRLILEDKVDFLFPPTGTEFLHEAAIIANKYGYILMGGAGGAIKLKEIIAGLPYFFNVLNFADTQMPVFAEILEELDVENVAILMVDDLHGVEYTATLTPLLALAGIDVKMIKAYREDDPDIADTIAAVLMEADALDVDAFISFSYPTGSFTTIGVAQAMGYNPKLFHLNLGPNWSTFPDMFGGFEGVEGVMGPGAWNSASADGVAAFEEKFVKKWSKGDTPIPLDYWGHLFYYAGCQFFQQAVEKAGTLDHSKIRDIMATTTFETIMGPVKFESGMMVGYVGQMGQWQDGVFEVIGPTEDRTADPIYPKPEWPEGEPGTDDDTDTDTETETEHDTSSPDAGESPDAG